MKASGPAVAVVLLLELALIGWARGAAGQSPMDLTGSWTLNRASSQFPEEIGFGSGGDSRLPEGPRGRLILPETEDDSRRRRFLSDEVRLPPEQLTIFVTPAVVTITPDRGAARTLQPGRRDDSMPIGPISAVTSVKWEGDRLTVAYNAETGRIVRYTYSLDPNSRQLLVDVEFVGRGGGDKVRRVYKPSPPGEPAAAPRSRRPRSRLGARGASATAGEGSHRSAARRTAQGAHASRPRRRGHRGRGGQVWAEGRRPPGRGDQAPDRRRAPRQRDTDDDTYLYVNVNTATAAAGLCVSRYDVTLYSHVAASLPHTSAPVLLQVELLHKGGLAGGGPAEHGDTVTKSVLESVDQFATRIKTANQ